MIGSKASLDKDDDGYLKHWAIPFKYQNERRIWSNKYFIGPQRSHNEINRIH